MNTTEYLCLKRGQKVKKYQNLYYRYSVMRQLCITHTLKEFSLLSDDQQILGCVKVAYQLHNHNRSAFRIFGIFEIFGILLRLEWWQLVSNKCDEMWHLLSHHFIIENAAEWKKRYFRIVQGKVVQPFPIDFSMSTWQVI